MTRLRAATAREARPASVAACAARSRLHTKIGGGGTWLRFHTGTAVEAGSTPV